MKITKIHGKYYDIENFKHPGGDDALWHSYGRDATSMFEQYHSMSNRKHLEDILEKYEVPENKIIEAKEYLLEGEDNVPQFDFNSDFAKEVKEKVRLYFAKKAKDENTTINKVTKGSNKRWFLIGILNLLRILCCLWWLSGSWYGLVAYPLFIWLSSVNTFHDANHFSLSSKWKINKFYGYFALPNYTPLVWYYQHNISHHCYTNIKNKDVDILPEVVFMRLASHSPYKSIYKFQHVSFIFQYALANFGEEMGNIFSTIRGKYYFTIIPKYNNLFDKTEILDKSIFLLFNSLQFSLYFWFSKFKLIFVLMPYFITNTFFMINSQITHIHADTFHKEYDWYKHQVLTSTNHSIGSQFAFIFSGGLNYQIEHHLFPCINHCHYPEIQPIVKSICQKYNVTYKEFNGYYDAFSSYYNHIKTLSKNKED